jgi:hypothetical protein
MQDKYTSMLKPEQQHRSLKISSGKEHKLDSDGFLHSDDGPAIIYENGIMEYFIHGVLVCREYPRDNRGDGWARYVYFNKESRIHRDGGPAIIFWDETELYYDNGKRHRIDGPQVCDKNGVGDIYYNRGKKVTKEYIERRAMKDKLSLI